MDGSHPTAKKVEETCYGFVTTCIRFAKQNWRFVYKYDTNQIKEVHFILNNILHFVIQIKHNTDDSTNTTV